MTERAGAPDPHAEMRGVLMLAASNESLSRSTTNDRRQRMHQGPDVLNGYRGLVEGIEGDGTVRVAWQQAGADGRDTHRAALNPAYVALGGITLGYAMTGHKAEGLTVAADWTRPDGVHQGGAVLVHAAGMDEPGLHVATSRHRDRVLIFAGRDQLEDANTAYERGVPATAEARDRRVIAALAEQAAARSPTANDRPVLDELDRWRRAAGSGGSGGGPEPPERHRDPGHREPVDAAARRRRKAQEQRPPRPAPRHGPRL
jgi:hypothetical protein